MRVCHSCSWGQSVTIAHAVSALDKFVSLDVVYGDKAFRKSTVYEYNFFINGQESLEDKEHQAGQQHQGMLKTWQKFA
jgi:hypothetical protein